MNYIAKVEGGYIESFEVYYITLTLETEITKDINKAKIFNVEEIEIFEKYYDICNENFNCGFVETTRLTRI